MREKYYMVNQFIVRLSGSMTENMNRSFDGGSRKYRENLIGAISAGFFFVLIGILFVITPSLLEKIIDLLTGLRQAQVGTTGIFLPAPPTPQTSGNTDVYMAAAQFCLAFGIFEIVLLVLRVALHSPIDKKAETASSIAYWFGSSYLINMLLVDVTRGTVAIRWFTYWAELIMLIGVTLIIRAIILIASTPRK
jgi:hypothetical protein